MTRYRGRVIKYDRINIAIVLIGLAATILLSAVFGIKIHWALSILFIFLYFIIASILVMLVKRKSNKYLRQS